MADNTKGATGSSWKARKGIGSVEESSERNGTKSKKESAFKGQLFSLGGGFPASDQLGRRVPQRLRIL